jgi:hypothetical protein
MNYRKTFSLCIVEQASFRLSKSLMLKGERTRHETDYRKRFRFVAYPISKSQTLQDPEGPQNFIVAPDLSQKATAAKKNQG